MDTTEVTMPSPDGTTIAMTIKATIKSSSRLVVLIYNNI